MTDTRNPSFLLKESNGKAPPEFEYETVMGLRLTAFYLNNDLATITHKEDRWRDLISGGAVASVSVSATGIFLNSVAETAVYHNALSGSVNEYQLRFDNGLALRGKFLVSKLAFTGSYSGEDNYEIQLESSGKVEAV